MDLSRTGREYASTDVTGLASGIVPEASLDGVTWVAMTRTGDTIKVLVAGPDATSNPANTIMLPLGKSRLKVRATDNPEIVVRDWGPFDVR